MRQIILTPVRVTFGCSDLSTRTAYSYAMDVFSHHICFCSICIRNYYVWKTLMQKLKPLSKFKWESSCTVLQIKLSVQNKSSFLKYKKDTKIN
jgi:hypothetical protein